MTLPAQSSGDPGPAGSRAVLETFINLIESAFESDPKHSLLANIRDLDDEEWTAVPAGGGRSVADVIEHVAWCKRMYEDYAFGSATLRGDQPPLVPDAGARSRPHDELLAWLTDSHHRWLASVRALPNDAELDRPRPVYWGDTLPTRTIIQIVIAHDLYHAGEINHLQALLQGTDQWPDA
jgi:uncharacterized damage-inducible protein DinB